MWEKVGKRVTLYCYPDFSPMLQFIGEYEVAVDAKGRFLLPSGLRKQLPEGAGEKFVISRGFEGCLAMYPLETYNVLLNNLSKLNDLDPNNRALKRLMTQGANVVEPDSAGRLLLSKPHMEMAGIKKDMVLSAQANKVELWDKDTYYNYLNANANDFSALAATVAGGSFNPFAE